MQYIRSFDRSRAFDTGFPGYQAQIVSSLETALLIGSWIGPGGCGPDLHYHHSDQSYFLVRGSMNVQLGEEVHRIGASTFVHIPAGLAHRNWNDSGEEEFHVEIIAPTPTPGAPLKHDVSSPEEAPGPAAEGFVLPVREEDFAEVESVPGMALFPLLRSDAAYVNAFRMAPGGAGPGTHIHEFDQYYVVLEGELEVEVALERHTAPAGSVVLLPAGVPHRQWNAADTHEVHLALLAPAPRPGVPWDRGVDVAFNGVTHSG